MLVGEQQCAARAWILWPLVGRKELCHGRALPLLLLLCCASDCDGAHVAEQSIGCSSTFARPLLLPAGSCPASGLPANPPLIHFIQSGHIPAKPCFAGPFVVRDGSGCVFWRTSGCGRSDAAVVLATLLLPRSCWASACSYSSPDACHSSDFRGKGLLWGVTPCPCVYLVCGVSEQVSVVWGVARCRFFLPAVPVAIPIYFQGLDLTVS